MRVSLEGRAYTPGNTLMTGGCSMLATRKLRDDFLI